MPDAGRHNRHADGHRQGKRETGGLPTIEFCSTHGPFSTPDLGKETLCPKCPPPKTAEELNERVMIGGLDLAKFHDYSALVLIEARDHKAKVVGIKVWPHVDYHVVVGDTTEICRRKDVRMLAIDATGVGAPISEMFAVRGVKTEDIKFGEYVEYTNPWGEHERAPVKYAMMEYARACLQAQPPQVVYSRKSPEGEELHRQLSEQQLIVGPTDRPTYAHPEGRHDDLAWAFLMALYTAREWITGNGLFAMAG